MTVSAVQTDEVTRFRITLWPGTPLPVPPTVRMQSELDPTGRVIVPRPEEHEGVPVLRREEFEPSGQTYLRLLEVDLDDPHAIVAFVNTYGILDGAWAHTSGLRELGEYDKVLNHKREWRAIKKALAAVSGSGGDHPIPVEFNNHELRYIQTLSELRTHGFATRLDNLWLRVPFVETLDEFRFAARCLHDVYWAWRVFNEGLDPNEIGWQSSPGLGFETLGLASGLLTNVLPRLGRIGPQLNVVSAPQALGPFRPWEPPHESTIEPHAAPPTARLYQACAIEIYNHIVEQATYHHCANQTCKRQFVHQEGRAHHGQHRKKGVKYCSPACARSQAQRNYRRRQRTGSEASEDPPGS
jgi:hypothetical protein